MSLPAAVTPAILDTTLGHLALHFLVGANGDLPAARRAAGHMLAAYGAETGEELRLAAEIIGFGFHALEALSEAACPDLPAAEKARLRGSAVSLSRESHKSQRKLDQLHRARPIASPPPEVRASPLSGRPGVVPALRLIAFAREALGDSAGAGGARGRVPMRVAEKPRRNRAEEAHRMARQAALADNAEQTGAA